MRDPSNSEIFLWSLGPRGGLFKMCGSKAHSMDLFQGSVSRSVSRVCFKGLFQGSVSRVCFKVVRKKSRFKAPAQSVTHDVDECTTTPQWMTFQFNKNIIK